MTLELPAFWRWWVAELAPLVPAAPRAAVQRRRLRPVLAFGDDTAVLWDLRIKNGSSSFSKSRVFRCSAILPPSRMLPVPRSKHCRTWRWSTRKVIVTLPPSQILRKQIVLPAAVEENLLQALTYDLDRHTPFRPEQLYFDAIVVSRDLARNEIRVDWAAALKSVVDQARRHAESWGATVVGVTPQAPARRRPLVETESASPRRTFGCGAVAALAILASLSLLIVATLLVVALPLWQKREFAVEHGQVTEQARLQASASDALRQQLDQATGDYNFALGKKYAFPSTLQLLDDVTRLLPDDTWLTQLEIKTIAKGKEPPHREMLLRGESGNAGRLISALEDSKLFEQAAPRSPTTKIQPGPGEVFDLGTQVTPSPTPQLVALAAPGHTADGVPKDAAAGTAGKSPEGANARAGTTPDSAARKGSATGGASGAAPAGHTGAAPGSAAAPAAAAAGASSGTSGAASGANPAAPPGAAIGAAPGAGGTGGARGSVEHPRGSVPGRKCSTCTSINASIARS